MNQPCRRLPLLRRLASLAALTSLLVLTACEGAKTETSVAAATPAEEQELGLAPFDCRASISRPASSTGSAGYARLRTVRAATHDGYDRFVLEFTGNSMVPPWIIARQANATFDDVTLPGRASLLVSLHPARTWDFTTETPTFEGERRLQPDDTDLMTAIDNVEDFEGYMKWLVGLERAACVRVFELSAPPRLVIDVEKNGPIP